jgi:hypothetical protein
MGLRFNRREAVWVEKRISPLGGKGAASGRDDEIREYKTARRIQGMELAIYEL